MENRHRLPILMCAAVMLASGATVATAEPPGAEVAFKIHIEPRRGGEILCALYDKENEWLSKKVFRSTRADPTGEWVTCTFTKVPRGIFAAAALHDEDGNKTMTKGLFGLPEEGYTTSRDAQEKGFYPDWEDAVFSFKGESPGVVVGHMHY